MIKKIKNGKSNIKLTKPYLISEEPSIIQKGKEKLKSKGFKYYIEKKNNLFILRKLMLFSLFLVLLVSNVNALDDTFEDGDYTSNPTWSIIDSAGGSGSVQSGVVKQGSYAFLSATDGSNDNAWHRLENTDLNSSALVTGNTFGSWIRTDSDASRGGLIISSTDNLVFASLRFRSGQAERSVSGGQAESFLYNTLVDTWYYFEIVYQDTSVDFYVYDNSMNLLASDTAVSEGTSDFSTFEKVVIRQRDEEVGVVNMYFDNLTYSTETGASNSDPSLIINSPLDNSLVTSSPILSVNISDSDLDLMNVSFYLGNSSLIATHVDKTSGSVVNQSFGYIDVDSYNSYTWYVNVTDNNSNTFQSSVYSFFTIDDWVDDSYSFKRNVTNYDIQDIYLLVNGSSGFNNNLIVFNSEHPYCSLYYNDSSTYELFNVSGSPVPFETLEGGLNYSPSSVYNDDALSIYHLDTALPHYDATGSGLYCECKFGGNCPSLTSSGAFGLPAYDFAGDGNNAALWCGNSTLQEVTGDSMTISFVMNMDSMETDTNYHMIGRSLESTGSYADDDFRIYLANRDFPPNDGGVMVFTVSDCTNVERRVETTTSLSTGVDYMITGVYDGDSNLLKIYVNGELNASSSVSISQIGCDTAYPFIIGGLYAVGAGHPYLEEYDGNIGQVRYYDFALDDNEINQIYNNLLELNASLASEDLGIIPFTSARTIEYQDWESGVGTWSDDHPQMQRDSSQAYSGTYSYEIEGGTGGSTSGTLYTDIEPISIYNTGNFTTRFRFEGNSITNYIELKVDTTDAYEILVESDYASQNRKLRFTNGSALEYTNSYYYTQDIWYDLIIELIGNGKYNLFLDKSDGSQNRTVCLNCSVKNGISYFNKLQWFFSSGYFNNVNEYTDDWDLTINENPGTITRFYDYYGNEYLNNFTFEVINSTNHTTNTGTISDRGFIEFNGSGNYTLFLSKENYKTINQTIEINDTNTFLTVNTQEIPSILLTFSESVEGVYQDTELVKSFNDTYIIKKLDITNVGEIRVWFNPSDETNQSTQFYEFYNYGTESISEEIELFDEINTEMWFKVIDENGIGIEYAEIRIYSTEYSESETKFASHFKGQRLTNDQGYAFISVDDSESILLVFQQDDNYAVESFILNPNEIIQTSKADAEIITLTKDNSFTYGVMFNAIIYYDVNATQIPISIYAPDARSISIKTDDMVIPYSLNRGRFNTYQYTLNSITDFNPADLTFNMTIYKNDVAVKTIIFYGRSPEENQSWFNFYGMTGKSLNIIMFIIVLIIASIARWKLNTTTAGFNIYMTGLLALAFINTSFFWASLTAGMYYATKGLYKVINK